MSTHYHAPTNSIRPLPKRVGMITDFPLASAETHRAHGYYPVAETVYVDGDAPGVVYDYDTQVATVTLAPAPPPAPEPPPPQVIEAAMALQAAVVAVYQDFGVLFDTSSGYKETLAFIDGPDSKIPPEHRDRVWRLLDTSFRQLEYSIEKHWKQGALAWDMLPALAAALQSNTPA